MLNNILINLIGIYLIGVIIFILAVMIFKSAAALISEDAAEKGYIPPDMDEKSLKILWVITASVWPFIVVMTVQQLTKKGGNI
jgi:hypothetical protein